MKTIYRKITFSIEEDTANEIMKRSKEQYLSVSAYIRKAIDALIAKEEAAADVLCRTTEKG